MNVLVPAGPQAAHIAALWWLTLALCALVFIVVLGVLAWGLWRAPRGDLLTPPDTTPAPDAEQRLRRRVTAAVAISTILLIGLLVASVATDRALAQLSLVDAVHIRVTAHQWWWDVVYDDPEPERMFATANELRVPVGRPVIATLSSDDVIHSFWVPRLAGKHDVEPGRLAHWNIKAERPGTYLGQCVEFCGLSHANMRLRAIAQTPSDFQAWVLAQRQSPSPPAAGSDAEAGLTLFQAKGCAGCHTVAGVSTGTVGPNLSHVLARTSFAGSTLEMNPENLRKWLANPPGVKPGSKMPNLGLSSAEITKLIAYLETLK